MNEIMGLDHRFGQPIAIAIGIAIGIELAGSLKFEPDSDPDEI